MTAITAGRTGGTLRRLTQATTTGTATMRTGATMWTELALGLLTLATEANAMGTMDTGTSYQASGTTEILATDTVAIIHCFTRHRCEHGCRDTS